jgi:hypothetical protein
MAWRIRRRGSGQGNLVGTGPVWGNVKSEN